MKNNENNKEIIRYIELISLYGDSFGASWIITANDEDEEVVCPTTVCHDIIVLWVGILLWLFSLLSYGLPFVSTTTPAVLCELTDAIFCPWFFDLVDDSCMFSKLWILPVVVCGYSAEHLTIIVFVLPYSSVNVEILMDPEMEEIWSSALVVSVTATSGELVSDALDIVLDVRSIYFAESSISFAEDDFEWYMSPFAVDEYVKLFILPDDDKIVSLPTYVSVDICRLVEIEGLGDEDTTTDERIVLLLLPIRAISYDELEYNVFDANGLGEIVLEEYTLDGEILLDDVDDDELANGMFDDEILWERWAWRW